MHFCVPATKTVVFLCSRPKVPPPPAKTPTPPPTPSPPPTPLPEYITQFFGDYWFQTLFPNATSAVSGLPAQSKGPVQGWYCNSSFIPVLTVTVSHRIFSSKM